MEPILIGRRDAAKVLGICIRSVDHAVATGSLKSRRLGRRVMLTPEELKRFAARDHVRIAGAPATANKELKTESCNGNTPARENGDAW
jgi:hypothetical protein